MKRILKFLIAFCFIVQNSSQAAISLVYNLRIAESTKKQLFEKGIHPSTFSITCINNNRKKRDQTKLNVLGLLESFSYSTETIYFRSDFAFGQVNEAKAINLSPNEHFCDLNKKVDILYDCRKKWQTDDILFKAGYSFIIRPEIKFTVSGLLGIPTHKDFALDFYQLGYGHVGVGFQLDSSFVYSVPKKSVVRCAFRLIQFVPRNTEHKANDLRKKYKVNIGNLIDVFFAHHTVIGHHTFEIGYDQIFFCNGKVHPYLEGALAKINYIRPEFFGTYKYTVVTARTHHIFGATLSGGFDIWPKVHGNKRIIEAWFSYGINY